MSDYLVFDSDIWTKAKEYIRKYADDERLEHILIPIVNKEGLLMCFAYDDMNANREIRMLRELVELNDENQFSDIFSEYECVKIYGFNELAFRFAEYLMNQFIDVLVYDDEGMWNEFYQNKKQDFLDYKCLNIWAEGRFGKKKNLVENMFASVTGEFGCIDEIYEKNIQKGLIRNAAGTKEELLHYLRGCADIVIMGTGREALDTYNYLTKHGIEISGFVDNRHKGKSWRLFRKDIVDYHSVKMRQDKTVWINPVDRGSAWGLGGTDDYDYIGYHRNKHFILIRDYIEIPCEGLKHILKGNEIACFGDSLLWENLMVCLKRDESFDETTFKYFEYEMFEETQDFISQIDGMYILWASPEEMTGRREWEERKNEFADRLERAGVLHYSDYFCSFKTVIRIQNNAIKYSKATPKKIIIGATRTCCGNTFIKGLLDNHPYIISIAEYNSINMELFWYCIRLAGKKKDKIMPLFLEIYKGELKSEKLFQEKMNQLLEDYETVSPQDLFVLFHIANHYMNNKTEVNIDETIIYWEPHYTDREFLAWAAPEWLQSQEVPCSILSLVRNCIQRTGCRIKGMLKMGWFGNNPSPDMAYMFALDWVPDLTDEKEETIIRFEDLKRCPKDILRKICKDWGIPWSDTLLKTTIYGDVQAYDNLEKKMRDFDLQSVYNGYEMFFSEIDKLRIMLLGLPYQKKYGYTYVEMLEFDRYELQELFLKSFRFETQLNVFDDKEILELRLRVQKIIHNAIQWSRMLNYELEISQERKMILINYE